MEILTSKYQVERLVRAIEAFGVANILTFRVSANGKFVKTEGRDTLLPSSIKVARGSSGHMTVYVNGVIICDPMPEAPERACDYANIRDDYIMFLCMGGSVSCIISKLTASINRSRFAALTSSGVKATVAIPASIEFDKSVKGE